MLKFMPASQMEFHFLYRKGKQFLLATFYFMGSLGTCTLHLDTCGSVDYIYMNINAFVVTHTITVNNRYLFKGRHLK